MDEKDLNSIENSRTNSQKPLEIKASIDELKKENEPEYVFLYWDDWR